MTHVPRPGRSVRGSRTGRPIMAALDLFGRRGTLRILWELREGRRLTFRELTAAADLNPATINTRLKELRQAGIIASQQGYGLTPMGEQLLVALEPLTAWSVAWAKSFEERPRSQTTSVLDGLRRLPPGK